MASGRRRSPEEGKTCSTSNAKRLIWAGRKLVLETGKMARQADGAVRRHLRRDHRARHRRLGEGAEARLRFLPAHRELPGAHLRGRPHSRRLLQARGPADREGDAGLAPHRPADPPALRPGYKNDTQVVVTVLSHDLENDPDIVAHGRGLGGADPLGRALHGPDRRRPRRLYRRPVQAQSAAPRDGGPRPSISSSPAPPTPC